MSWTHLHLLLNHIPVLGSVFGLLLLVVAMMRRSAELKKVSLGVFIIAALFAIPVYLTGNLAENAVENLPGVSESIVDQHQQWALISLAAVGVLGLFALGGLWLSRRSRALPTWIVTMSLIFSLTIGGLMVWTANLGGQIRHTEIRAELQSPASPDD